MTESRIQFHPRAALVGIEVVAALAGQTVERVLDDVDEGRYLWVFNVGSGTVKRMLRFWTRELVEPGATKNFSLDEAIKQIIPRRDAIAGQFVGLQQWELAKTWMIDRSTLAHLRDELPPFERGVGVFYPRAALENFLRRRWVASLISREPDEMAMA